MRELVNYRHPGPRRAWKVRSERHLLPPLRWIRWIRWIGGVSQSGVSFEAVFTFTPSRNQHAQNGRDTGQGLPYRANRAHFEHVDFLRVATPSIWPDSAAGLHLASQHNKFIVLGHKKCVSQHEKLLCLNTRRFLCLNTRHFLRQLCTSIGQCFSS